MRSGGLNGNIVPVYHPQDGGGFTLPGLHIPAPGRLSTAGNTRGIHLDYQEIIKVINTHHCAGKAGHTPVVEMFPAVDETDKRMFDVKFLTALPPP